MPPQNQRLHVRRFAPLLALLAVMVATVLAYWPGLGGPLVYDDAANLSPINDWLEGHVSWQAVVFGNDSGLLGRSLSMASFVVNVALLGPDPWGLKLGNLILHLLNGALVFALFLAFIRCDTRTPGGTTPRTGAWLAALGASIWLAHPLFASTVLYVVQRMAMLSTFFILLTMLAYLHGRMLLQARHLARAAVVLFGAAACTLFAALSKENGVLAPPLCGIIELVVFQPALGGRRARWSSAFIALVLAVPAAIAAALVVLRPDFVVAGYSARPFSMAERLLTEARILWSYLGDILIPNGPRLGFYHDDLPISRSLSDPPTTVIAIVAWLGTVAFAWRCRRTIPGVALGIGIFLVGHALESSIFPLMLYFEHRNYLPAVGAIWAILALAGRLIEVSRAAAPRASILTCIAAVALVLLLMGGTSIRARIWMNQQSIVAQAVLTHPDSRGARFDAIALALNAQPPHIEQARSDIARLLESPDPNTRRLGAILGVVASCRSKVPVEGAELNAIFQGPRAPLEEDLVHAFEILSDEVGTGACAGIAPGSIADGLKTLLDRWEPTAKPNWRLRFRAASLYVAADRNIEAVAQAQRAYEARPPINTSIMLAGLMLYVGDADSAARILDEVEPRVGASESLARKIIAEDRTRIATLREGRNPTGTVRR